MKFITQDRETFVKSQAIIAGVLMEDWLVEVIASNFCKQLGIRCVEQKECSIYYNNIWYKGVYSDNFEVNGVVFKSFESVINRAGLYTREDYFVKLSTIQKLEWCAKQLSKCCKLDLDDCIKYMIDLAIVDCLVGNTDRHTRNFGVFYNEAKGVYEIALIFDNGMGLFENDGFRDRYIEYEQAMNTCYVSPYGEDPFDMVKLLEDEYKISDRYNFNQLAEPEVVPSEFAQRYIAEMLSAVKSL